MTPAWTARAVGIVALSVCSCTNPAAPAGPQTADLKSSLSTAFDALAIPGTGACSMSISQHGEVVLERGRGQIGPGRPATGNSLYRIASLTKPITASAILVSEKAGRLLRSDRVSQFLAYPEPAPTLDELIKHIPGLPNYLATPAYQNGRTSPTTVETLLSLIQPWDGIRRYQYSNSHAILSGVTLQRVNGLPYEEVVQRDVFGPAGMSRSSFVRPPESESAQFPASTHPSWVYAAGGVTSTAADMNRFNQALLSNRFGFGAVEGFDRSAAGVTSFGMGSGVSGGDLRFTHAGGLDTYSSFSVMFPADRSSVVVLCNFNNNPDVLFKFVMGIRSTMLGSASSAVAQGGAAVDAARKTDVQIPAGDVTLAATLYMPAAGKGKVPAVVLGHGSAPSTRAMLGFWTNTALSSGVAVLGFDKRGTGASTGRFEPFDVARSPIQFQQQASDLAYAVRWLAQQPGIDTTRLGLMGGSQAGWTMPLAAAGEPLVRFIVAGCGVPLPSGVEAVHERYLNSLRPWPGSRPSVRQVHEADAHAMDYKGETGFDPRPTLEQLTIPVLWIFGLYDHVIPTNLSIDRIGEYQNAGKKNFDIHVLPFADHNFVNVFTKDRYSVSDVAGAWLRQKGFVE